MDGDGSTRLSIDSPFSRIAECTQTGSTNPRILTPDSSLVWLESMRHCFFLLFTFTFGGCSDESLPLYEGTPSENNRSMRTKESDPLNGQERKRLENKNAKEGPNGDMDGDGIPNQFDSDPLQKSEGPGGDMDGDGIPNKDDKDPLGQGE